MQTPCLVVLIEEIDRILALFEEYLPGVRLHYSVKANDAPGVLELFRDRGLGFEAASGGELKALSELGVSAGDIIVANTVLTRPTLDCVFDHQVPLVAADTGDGLDAIAREAARRGAHPPRLMIRVRVPSHAAQVDLNTKFGCDPPELSELCGRARDLGLQVTGLHFHVGSQCLDPSAYSVACHSVLAQVTALRNRGFDLKIIDIGGGMPDAETASQCGGLEPFFSMLGGTTGAVIDEGFTVLAEPGRCLVATAGYVVCSVTSRSVRDGRDWLFLDDGIYGLLSCSIYERRRFEFFHAAGEGAPRRFMLAGPTCDSLDVLGEVEITGSPEPGSLLVVPNAGAYSYSARTRFNGFDADRVVVLRAEGAP